MQKLFIYGSLCPGHPNEHILNNIGGTWEKGFVMGELFEEGWGAEMGYPGIRLNQKIEIINGYVFSSKQLKKHWSKLDNFEGFAYQRVKTIVTLEKEEKEVEAFIYALR